MQTGGALHPKLETAWRALRHAGLFSYLLLPCMLMSACKTSTDAAAAALQMQSTSQALAAYYASLSKIVEDTGSLEMLQSSLLNVPVGSQDIAQIQATQQEIQHRATLAKTLQSLSAALAKLSGSSTQADVSASANKLASELVSIQALPSGPPIPDALGKAGSLLTRAFQEHDERKAAKAMDGTLSAVSKLFTTEKPVYESLYATYIPLAASLASESVRQKWVDESMLLQPALRPFGLSSVTIPPQNLNDTLKHYALQRIQLQTRQLTDEQAAASDGMDQALQEMVRRIHRLARDKAMSERGNPVSLVNVESWLSQLGTM